MVKLKTGLLLLTLALGLSALQVSAQTEEDLSVDPSLLQDYFDRLGENGLSASVLVAQGDRILFQEAYGAQAAPQTPMTERTILDVGSLSKQFTAALVLMEVESGSLSLDDPVSKLFPNVPADKRSITLHQLLTHTSGLTEHSADDYEPMTKSEALRNIFASELAFAPGEDFQYSNSGYTLLAAILEEVTGETYTDLVRRRLFEPHGMKNSGFHGDAFLKDRHVAIGRLNEEWRTSPVDALPIQWGVLGNGGVMSTAEDMYEWTAALKSGSVLSGESLEMLWAPHVERRSGTFYGYGWWTYDSPIGRGIWHGGTGDGGNADVAYFPERDLISVILSNDVELIEDPETSEYIKIHLPAREARIALTKAIAEENPAIDPELTRDLTSDSED